VAVEPVGIEPTTSSLQS